MAAPAATADDRLERWRAGFEDMFALVAGRFAQVESRRRARMYVLGLLSGAERKHWRVAAWSRFSETRTSMTWLNWSIARYR